MQLNSTNSKLREKVSFLSIIKSEDEQYLAVITGRQLIKQESRAELIQIFQRTSNFVLDDSDEENHNFKQVAYINVENERIFEHICL